MHVHLVGLLVAFSLFFGVEAVAADSQYEAELLRWNSHEDVARWLKTNFIFDKGRQTEANAQLRASGPSNILTRRPEALFEKHRGYCRDAAGFARDALNKISPDYQARYIFIKNRQGPPNHWVTGFIVSGKLYVLDYGAGAHWAAMEGLHGPFESLDNYRDFLASLSIRGFAPEAVSWRDIPGQED